MKPIEEQTTAEILHVIELNNLARSQSELPETQEGMDIKLRAEYNKRTGKKVRYEQ